MMLKSTFVHIPGIGITTERRFWEDGIHRWEDFTEHLAGRLSSVRRDHILKHLEESRCQAKAGNPNYFSNLLPANLQWRYFPEFRNSTAYLDIETTGLTSWENEITTIALYDGSLIQYFVNGRNLNDFPAQIARYKVIITYNGKCFDIPFIENYFKIRVSHAHIDLRYILAGLGYKGGLKGCEAHLGISRGDLTDIDGFFAVLLWQDYKSRRNPKALETLLAYNIQDVLSLETLMVIAYNLKIAETPFGGNRLPMPAKPQNLFAVDTKTVARIKSGMWRSEYFF